MLDYLFDQVFVAWLRDHPIVLRRAVQDDARAFHQSHGRWPTCHAVHPRELEILRAEFDQIHGTAEVDIAELSLDGIPMKPITGVKTADARALEWTTFNKGALLTDELVAEKVSLGLRGGVFALWSIIIAERAFRLREAMESTPSL